MLDDLERPDLSQIDPAVVAYIEALEAAVRAAQAGGNAAATAPEPQEPPTTQQVISMTRSGLAKRTPRHLYGRQRRGGMGVFDIESDEADAPTLLAVADVQDDLLLVTDQGRIFRIAVSALPETAVRGRGAALGALVQLLSDEKVVALLPADAGLYVNLVSQRGQVRHVRNNYLDRKLIQGIRYHKISEGGYITAACWSSGSDDLFIATRSGQAIRFSEKQVPNSGCLGLRVDIDDVTVAIAATQEEGNVLLIGRDGKGTIRNMAGFRQNKAPGAGGKVAFKTDDLVGASAIGPDDDVFVLSRLSKIIRFRGDEIPAKEGVVQGVNCISLRADEVATFRCVPIAPPPADA